MAEGSEVYDRLRQLEQTVHTLGFRMDTVEEANLNNRVLSLESLVSQMTKDAARMEATAESIKEDVASMKSWGKGFVACLSAIVVLMGILPYAEGLFR
jgi:hypothetical protein